MLLVLGIALGLFGAAGAVIIRGEAPGRDEVEPRARAGIGSGTPVPLAQGTEGGGATRFAPWPWGDVPVAGGYEVPVHVVQALLAACPCPQLPEAGPASPQHVSTAWTNGTQTSALLYDSGVLMGIDDWDGETPEQWLDGMPEYLVETGRGGSIIPLRNTQGLGAAENEGVEGRAAHVIWMEGGHNFQVWGNGGQDLAELIEFAESLPYCPGCST